MGHVDEDLIRRFTAFQYGGDIFRIDGIAFHDQRRRRSQPHGHRAETALTGFFIHFVKLQASPGKQGFRAFTGDPAFDGYQPLTPVSQHQVELAAGPAVGHRGPGVCCRQRVMNDDRAGGSLARRLGEFVIPAAEVGHGVAVEKRRVLRGVTGVVDQDHNRFAPDICAGVIVPVAFGRVDSVTHKNQFRVAD